MKRDGYRKTLGLLRPPPLPQASGGLKWLGDLPQAFAEAEEQKQPVLLFVRDFFGEAYITHDWVVTSPDYVSLWGQMRLSGARWLWQRYQEDFFIRPEVGEAIAPFVRVCLTLDERMVGPAPPLTGRLDDWTRNLLVVTGVFTDEELAWRGALLGAGRGPHRTPGFYLDSTGAQKYRFRGGSGTALSEVVSRERSGLAVLSSKGELLHRFPPLGVQAEPAAKEFAEQLPKLLASYRTLAEGRAHLKEGRGEAAIASFRSLLAQRSGADDPEPVLDAVRQLAQSDLNAVERNATRTLAEAEEALSAKDYGAAWAKVSPLEKQGLVKVSEAISARFEALKQAVEANAQALSQQRQARRAAEASQLLASAQAADAGQDIVKAYRSYKQVADNFGDLPQGAEAKAKVAAWEADAEFMARLASLQAQAEAQEWVLLGNNYLVNHMYPQAIEQYTKVLDKHPDTPATAEARTKLEQARSALQEAEKKAAEGQPSPAP